MQRDRGPGEVHQAEWAEPDPELLAGHCVNLRSRGDSLLEEPAGLVDPRHEESVHHESGPVLADDDDLAHRLAVLLDGLHRLFGCGLCGDDLHETVLGGVVEPVHSHEPVLPLHLLG